jgi:hypothetical protein
VGLDPSLQVRWLKKTALAGQGKLPDVPLSLWELYAHYRDTDSENTDHTLTLPAVYELDGSQISPSTE